MDFLRVTFFCLNSTSMLEKCSVLTGSFRALRRKKALQLSHPIAPKWYPFADDSQMTQVKIPSLVLFFLRDVCTLL
jgi:hypothetical protein